MRNRKHGYDHLIANILPILWRRQLIIYSSILFMSFGAFLVYGMIGERYEAYTLLRVGQGIKDRTANPDSGNLGEGVDLASRIDSLARIGATDHVLQLAASNVGYDRLFQDDEAPLLVKLRMAAKSYFLKTFSDYFDASAQDQKGRDQNGTKDIKDKQEIAAALRALISAKQEGRSDLLRISFRYPDPVIAADFLNQLANSLVAVQADLVQIPGAEVFFQQQSKRLELEAEKAAADLQNFSVAASIYSVADQRGLLLKRVNDLATQLATTRGLIEERKGQKQAMMDQLAALKPVTQSKTVSSIVNTLGGSEFRAKPSATGTILEEAPPLLLVRVYQDAMATLLKINTELSGYAKMEKLIGIEIEQVNSELASLSSKEAEYDRLKRLLTRASAAADHYGTRMGEEQISSDIAKKSQFSSLRVVQLAAVPLGQTFPQVSHLAFLALFGGFSLGSAIIVMLELKRLHAQNHEEEQEADSTMVEFSKQSLRRYKRELQAAE